MSESVRHLIRDAAEARRRVCIEVRDLLDDAGSLKPAPDQWSIAEILEHLVLAELAGINRVWRAAASVRAGHLEWTGDPVHRGKSIETIVAETWRPKETAPDVAQPRWGGPTAFWAACLEICQVTLEALAGQLAGLDLKSVIYPHPISGPLDARQRLEFLRFHMDRHAAQVRRVKSSLSP